MKDKVKSPKIMALMLSLAVITSVVIAGTFAKYTSEYKGSDTALVAKWAFGFGEDADIAEEQFELNIFDHLYTEHINAQDDDETYIIAPGVSGEFTIDVTNLSDVDAYLAFVVKPDEDSPDLPIEFAVVEGSVVGDWKSDLDFPAGEDDPIIIEGANSEGDGGTYEQTIQWRWLYEGEGDTADETDTGLGKESADNEGRTEYTVNVTVKATQVAPEKTTTTP